MTANKFTRERYLTGKHVKFCRQRLGYNRKRFGKILGFTDARAKSNMMNIETGMKSISSEKLAMVNWFMHNGMPDDAPPPNLETSRRKYLSRISEQVTPRIIELRRSQ